MKIKYGRFKPRVYYTTKKVVSLASSSFQLNATVGILSKKAIDVFLPDGSNAFGEKCEHCSLRFTDSV